MKALLTTLLVLTLGFSYAQDTISKNELVIDYVRENMNKRVGNGVCAELVVGAADLLEKFGFSADTAHAVSPENVMVGDIIFFDGVVGSWGERIDEHIGIVYNIFADGKIAFAEQNIISDKKNTEKVVYYGKKVVVAKDSHVVITIIHPPSILKGKITYARLG